MDLLLNLISVFCIETHGMSHVSEVGSFFTNVLAVCSGFCFLCCFLNVTPLTRESTYVNSEQWFSMAGNFEPPVDIWQYPEIFLLSQLGDGHLLCWSYEDFHSTPTCRLILGQTLVFEYGL